MRRLAQVCATVQPKRTATARQRHMKADAKRGKRARSESGGMKR